MSQFTTQFTTQSTTQLNSRKKSPLNKTIDISIEDEECKKYFQKCISVTSPQKNISNVLDKTICASMFEVLPFLPKESVDLIIADPPYNLTKNFGGNIFSKKKSDEYEKYTRKWLSLVAPLLKKSGSIYVCADWQTSIVLANVLQEFFIVRNRITWQREKGRGAKMNWKGAHEDVWFATVSNDYTFNLDAVKMRRKVIAPYRENGMPKDWQKTEYGNFRDTCPSNFWDDITVPFWSMPENTAHPTQKPEKLLAKILLASSNKGDVVLDPFLGSGSTSVTAKKLSRHYIGIEQNAQYCAWAEKRLALADCDTTIQGYSDGVFWDRNSQKSASKAHADCHTE